MYYDRLEFYLGEKVGNVDVSHASNYNGSIQFKGVTEEDIIKAFKEVYGVDVVRGTDCRRYYTLFKGEDSCEDTVFYVTTPVSCLINVFENDEYVDYLIDVESGCCLKFDGSACVEVDGSVLFNYRDLKEKYDGVEVDCIGYPLSLLAMFVSQNCRHKSVAVEQVKMMAYKVDTNGDIVDWREVHSKYDDCVRFVDSDLYIKINTVITEGDETYVWVLTDFGYFSESLGTLNEMVKNIADSIISEYRDNNSCIIYIGDTLIKSAEVNDDIQLIEGESNDTPLKMGTLRQLMKAFPDSKVMYRGRILNLDRCEVIGEKCVIHLDNLYYVEFECSVSKENKFTITLQNRGRITLVDKFGNLYLKDGSIVLLRGLDSKKIVKDGNNQKVSLVGTKEYILSEYTKIITKWTKCCADSWVGNL